MVQLPAAPELSAKLLQISTALSHRNAEYQGTVYASANVTLVGDAEGWYVRDFWIAAPNGAGQPSVAPPQGRKVTGNVTPGMTSAACDTLAASMIANMQSSFPNEQFVFV